jgi:hypothetical protein
MRFAVIFLGEENCLDGISTETWFRRWDELLSNTVTTNAENRLITSELVKVRQSLTGW